MTSIDLPQSELDDLVAHKIIISERWIPSELSLQELEGITLQATVESTRGSISICILNVQPKMDTSPVHDAAGRDAEWTLADVTMERVGDFVPATEAELLEATRKDARLNAKAETVVKDYAANQTNAPEGPDVQTGLMNVAAVNENDYKMGISTWRQITPEPVGGNTISD